MENLVINEIPDSPFYPSVHFNAETGICEVVGESYMEETFKFYTPLLDWLKNYTYKSTHLVTFNFKLTYFNTSSSRLILDILDVLREHKEKGAAVEVNWYFDEGPDMEDEVEDFMIESGLEINMVKF